MRKVAVTTTLLTSLLFACADERPVINRVQAVDASIRLLHPGGAAHAADVASRLEEVAIAALARASDVDAVQRRFGEDSR